MARQRARDSCVLILALALGASGLAPSAAGDTPGATTGFAWPLAWPITHPRLRITNYPDDDPSPYSSSDYMGGNLSYEGHLGTDFNVNSFRDMDGGAPVLAAADGLVFAASDDAYDRQISLPPVPWNYVEIMHGDGTISTYGHLRRNSVTVHIGEFVRQGQIVGLIGSSGSTWMPHLHFEVAKLRVDPNGVLNFDGFRDPWTGPQNPAPSLWLRQEDYVGADHFRLLDVGVTTLSAYLDVGGTQDQSAFKERPSQPAVMGINEKNLKVWALVYGQIGDPYSIEVHRPDGSLFTKIDAVVQGGARNSGRGWQLWDVPFSASVSAADYGLWNAQVYSGGTAVETDSFAVGATSTYAPRFHWLSGKSLHLLQESQFDTLLVSRFGAPYADLTFSLENAPSNVSIAGVDGQGHNLIQIGPAGPDLASIRSSEFDVLVTDPSGLQDRKHYHLVNDAASILGPPPAAAAPGTASATEGDTLVVDISATDPDGDAIADLTADLSKLPLGNRATFTAGPDHATGRLSWPTKLGENGVYSVTFTARTSLGASPVAAYFGFPPVVQTGTARTTITIRKGIAARAFTTGGDRTIRLDSGKPRYWVYLEPMNASFGLTDVDPSTVQLVSEGTGSVDRISAWHDKSVVIGDKDRNSVSDIAFCFEKAGLQRLFDEVAGRHELTASLDGMLMSGDRFSAELDLDVVGGGDDRPIGRVAPNPLNPEAVLTLRLSKAGPLRVQLYDTHGRLVRTLLDTNNIEAGMIQLRIDTRDTGAGSLGSGVYFFRASSVDGVTTGRFVVLK